MTKRCFSCIKIFLIGVLWISGSISYGVLAQGQKETSRVRWPVTFRIMSRTGQIEFPVTLQLMHEKTGIHLEVQTTKDGVAEVKLPSGLYSLRVISKGETVFIRQIRVLDKPDQIIPVQIVRTSPVGKANVNQKKPNVSKKKPLRKPSSTEEPSRQSNLPPQTLWKQAVQAFQNGDYVQAKKSFQAYLQKKPDDGSALYNMGLVLLKLNACEDALGFFQRSASLKPDWMDPLIGLAQCAVNVKDWDLAQETLQKLVEVDPQNVTYWYNLAVVSRNLMDQKTELSAWRKIAEINPNSPEGILARQMIQAIEKGT